jgi:hypothetical protein
MLWLDDATNLVIRHRVKSEDNYLTGEWRYFVYRRE